MLAGIANLRFPSTSVAGKTFACATRNFPYLVRSPLIYHGPFHKMSNGRPMDKVSWFRFGNSAQTVKYTYFSIQHQTCTFCHFDQSNDSSQWGAIKSLTDRLLVQQLVQANKYRIIYGLPSGLGSNTYLYLYLHLNTQISVFVFVFDVLSPVILSS